MSQLSTVTSKRKRKHESYNLNERIHEQFNRILGKEVSGLLKTDGKNTLRFIFLISAAYQCK
uniref:Uncharacterized protein n=1 Tax=Rhizophagus irregularis (strain DAOM 181602 / DAOM 197198 / MUCL 43194) TaxID=747089 RepID=U9UEL2_RHIID